MKPPLPKPIGIVLPGILKSLGLDAKLGQLEVLRAWPLIVGEQIAAVTSAERIQDGKLFISVKRAPWRNELVFLKKELIKRINAAMQRDLVKDIIFR